MCGIFGLVAGENSSLTPALLKSTTDRLFRLSESRGKESSGLACLSNKRLEVYKQPVPASILVGDRQYKRLLSMTSDDDPGDSLRRKNEPAQSIAILGHTRLVTNGRLEDNRNNQPVIKSGIVGVHNGIVVNDEDIWKRFPFLSREYEVDTEVILALIRNFLIQESLTDAVRDTFGLLKGSASIATLFQDTKCLLLATNTGSLYTYSGDNIGVFMFASERFILDTLLGKHGFKKTLGEGKISQVKAGDGLVVDIANLQIESFNLNRSRASDSHPVTARASVIDIVDLNKEDGKEQNLNRSELSTTAVRFLNPQISSLDDISSSIASLRRCTQCILPETVPFIEFDEQGVCNYCRDYRKMEFKGESALEDLVAEYRSKDGEPDCIVMFSGGRDSCYGLHYVKNVLKMNPIAYTYDWGMITDLGRRNQSRMCGKLGIEHILVSADIKRKRKYIKNNIAAWFKRPDLGMVPLFMAGDKQFFYYANQLRKQTGVRLIVFCECPFEKTDFKSGFCGVRPQPGNKSVYTLSIINRMKMVMYYARQYILNPAYINGSIFDTIGAFFSFYVMRHTNLSLYHYIGWDEDKIVDTLRSEYDWELAPDTIATWRIGDGTAPFYNYIYWILAGFTENDTFRSNQIREGVLSRERAMELAQEENRFRHESFQWYCATIGIDFENALRKIRSIPRLYFI